MAESTKVWENDISESTIKKIFTKDGFDVLPEIKEQDAFPQIQRPWENLHSQGHIADNILLNELLRVNKLFLADYKDIVNLFCEIENEMEKPGEENDSESISKTLKKEMREAFEIIRCGLQIRGKCS